MVMACIVSCFSALVGSGITLTRLRGQTHYLLSTLGCMLLFVSIIILGLLYWPAIFIHQDPTAALAVVMFTLSVTACFLAFVLVNPRGNNI
ncbi:hypothetical protein HAT2_00664 [Candidatus Similichlamydia laticola]|uniref:Uncharacterized protein n=2 Tax=Candidatus Similichlamydia laticola TaxID=2170265 RepID=A0A369KHE7_9BACT|nr:hypothetical protein HAT2_00664 [Candidatus Similichlamydia laticola]